MFDFATKDLSLAIVRHLLIFLLAGILAFEVGVIRLSMKGEDVLRVARVDTWYGILAGAILVVGFLRAIYAAKGWAYYEVKGFFWAKIAAFALVGLLSIIPTIQIIRWRRALKNAAFFQPHRTLLASDVICGPKRCSSPSFRSSPPQWLAAMAPSRTDGGERCATKIPPADFRFGSKPDMTS